MPVLQRCLLELSNVRAPGCLLWCAPYLSGVNGEADCGVPKNLALPLERADTRGLPTLCAV
eukprot:3170717-Amphidinium_carterae.1